MIKHRFLAMKFIQKVVLSCTALAGSLYVLDTAGVVSLVKTPSAQASLRGDRRLQQTAGLMNQGAQQVGQMAGQSAGFMNQGTQQVGQMTGQAGQMVQQGAAGMQQGAAGMMEQGVAGMQQGAGVVQQGATGMQQGLGGMQGGFGQTASNALAYGNEAASPFKGPSMVMSYLPKSFLTILLPLQVIFAIIYYCTVVANYPQWFGPNPASYQIQSEFAPAALTQASPANCCLSYLCPQARAAHTFDKTGTLDYWCGVVAMFLCPFCTLCWANACTDLNPKLGGQPANILASAACTWLCSCCVIAQDAESLDACTGFRTQPCSVEPGMTPYGGGMGMMQQQQMYPQF